ncbi:MAG: ATP-binding protein, partial [Candidatus Eremiobacteraeota bacterium]|nr:ATP-binding protein [Candidatus Eremiobacteraeota bacterium]
MSSLQVPSTINIQPTARVLRVLGEIEFHPWQCLAELIDNAFDDFLEIERLGIPWPDGFVVSITLPTQVSAESKITIMDTGRGMNLQSLQNAVRAGWSSNELFNKLGLFGIGFNIATARLGKTARILTSPESSPVWMGIEIDLEKIGDDFAAPLIQKPKDSINEHGTIVEVGRLDRKRTANLGKNAANIRTKLGEVYSYLLTTKQYKLYVNGVQVKPRVPCAWGESRYVTFGTGSTAEQIHAVIKIDQTLQPMNACSNCGNWQLPAHPVCQDCGSDSLVERPRRVHGWLGIQRYVHKTDFGIDFLRNGRKILLKDKRLFQWTDPNDPLALPELEYPVELGQGRIIGEIHLDHLPVNYQKNAFEWSDYGWLYAVDLLRGPGPLLPKRAKQLGYGENESPLGKLHKAFRRTDPGYRYLVPGDGANAIHGTTLEWKEAYYRGEPEFQSDEKWWEAVVHHEAKQHVDLGSDDDKDILDELGLGPDVITPAPPPVTTKPPAKPKADPDRISE